MSAAENVDLDTSIQRQFGAAATNYVSSPVHSGGPTLEGLVARAALTGRERVLDVGTGAGHTALALAPRAAEVIALDLTEEMLSAAAGLARERGLSNVWFRRGRAEALPFADGAFDLVTSRLCAHHYADPAAATREAARVLRPGGQYLLVDAYSPEDPVQDTYLNAIEVLRDPSHVRNYRISEWQAMFEAAGFALEVGPRWAVRLEFASWVERIGTPAPLVAGLRALIDAAPSEVRETLQIARETGHDWSIPIALFVAKRR
ncbi:MAG TPA: class I SAM-dependent methyltransferase [Myxococcota bacterium]|nr:class I SAM-dependent methyltransferase [Myxococcota bacterium]